MIFLCSVFFFFFLGGGGGLSLRLNGWRAEASGKSRSEAPLCLRLHMPREASRGFGVGMFSFLLTVLHGDLSTPYWNAV